MKAEIAAPVLQVSHIDASLRHYKEVLGFQEDFRVGSYAGIKLGKAVLHLTNHGPGEFAKPIGGSVVYIFCDEIDGYFDQVKNKVAIVKYPPHDTEYGIREFMIADLDGHHLAFGCDLKKDN
jgi:uncharacterized glyoxalase superfamily protein PhnB